ncbi:hypothetical protein M407DRAFT_30355 [Tulasnella calospora MUT 4182]|uniref:Uncharacterized protein n=1 Tax=Tulasnella calospora MUT 4182 TaxID=1051891 RepID=A0A0C3LEX8_9AGAM|nr:hypothetical protein M407DRAFT_30355 [Tulasnella calospora MUT 4182]
MISAIIGLTDSNTPIIPLILSLILHARRDGQPLPRLPYEIPTTVADDSQPETVISDAPPHALEGISAQPATEGEDNAGGPSTVPHDSDSVLRPFGAYWAPENLDEPTLVDLLGTLSSIPMCWNLFPYSKDILHPSHQKDSSIWAMPGAINLKSLTIMHLAPGVQHTPPPSPSLQPFLLQLHSNAGEGATGWVFRGTITGLPRLQLVAKLVPADQMLNELEIWRKIRFLAGIKVPGLYGAYVFDNECQNK